MDDREFHEMNIHRFCKELESAETWIKDLRESIAKSQEHIARTETYLQEALKNRAWAIQNLENSKNALIAMDGK